MGCREFDASRQVLVKRGLACRAATLMRIHTCGELAPLQPTHSGRAAVVEDNKGAVFREGGPYLQKCSSIPGFVRHP